MIKGLDTPLLSTAVPFEISQLQKDAIKEILTLVQSAPALHLIDKDEPIYIAVDWGRISIL